jgi:ClpP class serine protease
MSKTALDAALSTHWAMEAESLRMLVAIADRRGPWRLQAEAEPVPTLAEDAEGVAEEPADETPEGVATKAGTRLEGARRAQVRDGVAIIPVTGPIFRRANLVTEMSGATSIELLARDLQQAAENVDVKAILLDVDSPGGQVDGTGELAAIVAQINRKKPVHCYSGGVCASAAYWIAAACETLTIAPTTRIGSIGVLAAFRGKSKDEIELVSSQSPDKSPDLALDAGRAVVQKVLDDLAAVFIADVAKYRGVSEATVLSDFGRGAVLVGKAAVKVGMADRVSTFETTLRRIAAAPAAQNRKAVAALPEEPHAADPESPGAGELTALTLDAEHERALTCRQAHLTRLRELAELRTEQGKPRPLTDERRAQLATLRGQIAGELAEVDLLVKQTAPSFDPQPYRQQLLREQAEVNRLLAGAHHE